MSESLCPQKYLYKNVHRNCPSTEKKWVIKLSYKQTQLYLGISVINCPGLPRTVTGMWDFQCLN